jgi:hypothetical protein
VKVAVVEALLCIGEPLSVAQFAKIFRGQGEEFREANVRYHVRHLVKVGVLEIVFPESSSSGSGKEKFVYFVSLSAQKSEVAPTELGG